MLIQHNNWIFELGQSENLNPVWIIVGFMRHSNKFNSQVHNNSVFDHLPVNFTSLYKNWIRKFSRTWDCVRLQSI